AKGKSRSASPLGSSRCSFRCTLVSSFLDSLNLRVGRYPTHARDAVSWPYLRVRGVIRQRENKPLFAAPIAWGWFEAIARIPDRMLALARRYLCDPWRASELSEEAVHRVWRRHGDDFGRRPEGRLYAHAAWHAKDLQAGPWHERRGIVTGLDDLENVVRERILVDPANYDRRYQGRIDYRTLSDRLDKGGLEDVRVMLALLRDGATWDEVGERLGRRGDA